MTALAYQPPLESRARRAYPPLEFDQFGENRHLNSTLAARASEAPAAPATRLSCEWEIAILDPPNKA
jgi:hypothetical protein